jgi:hypothetical protein
MADPVPAANAALLAAQAQSGQAGVAAYQAAQQNLAAQKQQAVEQAMREAAMRGAPTGAMESQQSIMTLPYDQRIASLGQSQAAFQADMAARDQRLAAYGAAVQGARSFIPQQTEQIVAPIRARGEYEVRQTEREGQMRVSEIEANLRLTEAKMAAAFQAAKIAAAKQAAKDAEKAAKEKANPLNQGELQSMLSAGAMERIGNLTSQLSQHTTANRNAAIAAGQQAMTQTNAEARAALSPAQQRLQQRENQAAETAFSTSRSRGATSTRTQQAVASALARVSGRQGPVGSPWDLFNRGSGRPSTPASFPGSPYDIFRDQGVDVNATSRQVAQRQTQQTSADRARIMAEQNRNNVSRLQQAFAPYKSEYGFITPEQLKMFDPLDAQMVTNSPRFLGDDFDINRFIAGGSSTDELRGASDPYSMQVMRDALGGTGDELLAQGYEFDTPEFMNAIQGNVQSFANQRAEDTGMPSTVDAYEARIKAAQERDEALTQSRLDRRTNREEAIEDADEELDEAISEGRSDQAWWETHDPVTGQSYQSASDTRIAAQDELDQWFLDNLNGPPPPSLGATEQTRAIAESEEFTTMARSILADPTYTEKGFLTPEEMIARIEKAGASGMPLSRGVRDLLKHYFMMDDEPGG